MGNLFRDFLEVPATVFGVKLSHEGCIFITSGRKHFGIRRRCLAFHPVSAKSAGYARGHGAETG